MPQITQILAELEQGDPVASEKLLPLVYDELRKLAAAKLAAEKPGQTLQATALVHEAYLRLIDGEQAECWNSRGHFFGAAAIAIRRILVDQARRKQRLKHGGRNKRVPLEHIEIECGVRPEAMIHLDEAIDKLQAEDPVKAQVVQLRFFVGMTHAEVAQAMGFSEVTARRHWRFARAWLRQQLDGSDQNSEDSLLSEENSEKTGPT
jgi:RNA polymerase sigma factor (TIGR02999 family)